MSIRKQVSLFQKTVGLASFYDTGNGSVDVETTRVLGQMGGS